MLDTNEAKKIATEYISQIENIPDKDIKIEGFKPFTWSRTPCFLFNVIILKHNVDHKTDPNIWRAGVMKSRYKIWLTASEGKIVGYEPVDQVLSEGQKIPLPNTSYETYEAFVDPFAEDELIQSEIERNNAESKYYKQKTESDSTRELRKTKTGMDRSEELRTRLKELLDKKDNWRNKL